MSRISESSNCAEDDVLSRLISGIAEPLLNRPGNLSELLTPDQRSFVGVVQTVLDSRIKTSLPYDRDLFEILRRRCGAKRVIATAYSIELCNLTKSQVRWLGRALLCEELVLKAEGMTGIQFLIDLHVDLGPNTAIYKYRREAMAPSTQRRVDKLMESMIDQMIAPFTHYRRALSFLGAESHLFF